MAATIKLDKPHSHFTNLDHITGRVILQLHTDTAISAIHVKLEGESRTRLSAPRNDQNKKKTEIEVHKILYKVKAVFPSPDIAQHSSPNAAFTLAPGVYEYPFEFKFPFNNACSNQNSMMTNLSMVGLRVEVARDTYAHVKKTLPPSLSTFPGEAEIKYYVKTTVVRPQFFKENIRSIAGFNFLPIEPPRNGNPNEETYARRQHEFMRTGFPPAVKKGGLFRKQSSTPLVPLSTADPVRVSVDARLPNPPILTCNQPIPLRIIVTKKSPTTEPMFLQLLQIELISYTNIRAHELVRTEPLSTLIISRSNMNVLIGPASDPMGKEWAVDASLWNQLPLPPNVAPTFETCNISRHYELEVRVGLSHGPAGRTMPQIIVVPLRLAVKVYSGIRPPPELLEAMTANMKLRETQLEQKSKYDDDNPPPQPPRPSTNQPAELDSHVNNVGDDDAPPSYEDAMAELISPIDGPRGEYHHTPAPAFQGNRNISGDTKMPFPDSHNGHNEDDHHFNHEGDEDGGEITRSFSRDSSESIDMLPQSPRLRPISYADSVFEGKTSDQTQTNPNNNSTYNDNPASGTQQHSQQPPQTFPTFPTSQTPQPRRVISTGIPNRRPVPNSSQTQGNNPS
ncbi:arrestin (or S-antigen) domain protein [Talaromyces stipitatus ATCC 10500]|uniref:Arrestin (Or S-antigen) domain protein n=1 Tax=Talaromyces stipitatus (strain ATCC 10500 / CBS 375.48 / QM 6759 / NRRL 1006) TaxID=441959 RepID=B8MU16_TALSN|nr:arrestin (or S-antigen) domain protein [Talaromyces stipitatus ATCC 10500]EED12649.1 arrestin (or S-antigen) domain protein [Talaromyces stipitatus ATCC 10500]